MDTDVAGLGRLARRVLVAAPWFILIVGPGWMALVSKRAPNFAQTVLTVSLAPFFILLVTRLALAARAQRDRRSALVLLLVGVALFAAGSSVLNGSGNPDLTQFPAPGEWLFLASYLAMAGYLVLDTSRRASAAMATWLETAVICGGSACLAGAFVLAVAARNIETDGLPLLLALLYPLIDIVLGLLVIAQIALRTRGRVRASAGLLIGFALLATADSGFLLHLSNGTYDYSILSIDLWGSRLRLDRRQRLPRADGGARARPAGVAVTALVVARRHGRRLRAGLRAVTAPIRTYLLVPALATLGAAGARLVLAVRTRQPGRRGDRARRAATT